MLVAGTSLAQDPELDPGQADAAETPDEGGGEPEPSAIDTFYDGLTAENAVAKVEGFYAPQVLFEDPFGRVEGKDQVAAYYKKVLAGVLTLQVDVKEEFVSADETVAVWTMTFTHKSLATGERISVDGVTHVRMADGKVIGQKNYFDLGALLYENVPILGSFVRWIKGKALGG
jgi:limonene-1,2-epoxide hydrolase